MLRPFLTRGYKVTSSFIANNTHNYASKWLVLSIDCLLTVITYFLTYSIYTGLSASFDNTNLFTHLCVVFILSLFSFLIVGSYEGVVRHTGFKDANELFKAVTLLLVLHFVVWAGNDAYAVMDVARPPFSGLFTHFLLTGVVLIVSRLIFKYCYYFVLSYRKNTSRVLIYGAGESGLATYEAVKNDSELTYDVIGIIDDHPNKIGKKINGVSVLDSKDIDASFIQKYDINEIIISIQKIGPSRLSEISDPFLQLGIKVKRVPAVKDWINGSLETSQIKEIQIEDLLDRAAISIQNENVHKEISNQVIFITGAAGSIGSELVRQLAVFDYKQLILIDQAESPLYDVQQELLRKGVTHFVPIVCDLRDYKRVEMLFERYRPDMIFHAAAYKHVPLMENNPGEAIKINVLATQNLADTASEYGVKKFVLVSTDKAVNPTNVMGATKRAAEMYIKSLQSRSTTKFITTRFGNVLGSNGSVIPLFRNQIAKGGPLTVTHKEITRFFMTIPEASQLVIEAGTMGQGGEIFIFDMGKSVKIFDLAQKMIRLSGLEYPNDIDIVFTGLRPGEKLYEELLADGENVLPTHHKKIMISKHSLTDCKNIREKFDLLHLFNVSGPHQEMNMVRTLKEIVPEFISQNSTFAELDKSEIEAEVLEPESKNVLSQKGSIPLLEQPPIWSIS